jgi:broad specificity phosphatase PhoE
MTASQKEQPPDFDEDFAQAVVAWRKQYKLKEDDAALLLIELFRIHQRHWDELRRRELPSFNQFRSDIGSLAEASKKFQQQASALIDALEDQPPASQVATVTRATAIFAAFTCLLAGYLIGKALL